MVKRLYFLGTGCMMPTKDRNHLSIAFEYEGEILMFDCGEATQNQIKKIKLPIGKITKIFISHWHGDHVLGLPGLIQTLNNVDSINKIEIHGPKDSKEYVEHMIKCSIFELKKELVVKEHILKKNEIKKVYEGKNYSVTATNLEHSVDCLAYSFKENDSFNIDKEKLKKYGISEGPHLQRLKQNLPITYKNKYYEPEEFVLKKKGLKISFVFDTRPTQNIIKLVKDSDVLVMEATYLYKDLDKAEEYKHMTARETGEIASEAGVKKLFITHFSQRYKNLDETLNETRDYFENTELTKDLMKRDIN